MAISGEQPLELACKIVQILQEEDKHKVKFVFKPGYLELDVDPDEGLHLGEEFTVTAKIQVEKIVHNLTDHNNNNL